MKKNIRLTLLFVLFLVSCSSEPALKTMSIEENVLNDGVYQGQAQGRNGIVTVEVHVMSQLIKSVYIINHQEDTRYVPEVELAIVEIPQRIVESDSTQVDVVSKATVSSKAIIKAVENALKNSK